jgi:hypothetical protein
LKDAASAALGDRTSPAVSPRTRARCRAHSSAALFCLAHSSSSIRAIPMPMPLDFFRTPLNF